MRNLTRTACPRRVFSHLAVIALCLAAPMVAGQDNPATDNQDQMALEEVIVTARKREESLQETPVAISAFSAEELEVVNREIKRPLSLSVV